MERRRGKERVTRAGAGDSDRSVFDTDKDIGGIRVMDGDRDGVIDMSGSVFLIGIIGHVIDRLDDFDELKAVDPDMDERQIDERQDELQPVGGELDRVLAGDRLVDQHGVIRAAERTVYIFCNNIIDIICRRHQHIPPLSDMI